MSIFAAPGVSQVGLQVGQLAFDIGQHGLGLCGPHPYRLIVHLHQQITTPDPIAGLHQDAGDGGLERAALPDVSTGLEDAFRACVLCDFSYGHHHGGDGQWLPSSAGLLRIDPDQMRTHRLER